MEQDLREEMEQRWTADMQKRLNFKLTDPNVIGFLKFLMSNQADKYVYHGLRAHLVTLCNGRQISINSPYFVRQVIKPGPRPKGGYKDVSCYPGLELLGFIDHKSPGFITKAVRAGVSSSSFDAASKALRYQGVEVSSTHICSLCYRFADFFMNDRVDSSLDGTETQPGLLIEITTDGGRVRLKENIKQKNGRRKKGSYDAPWKEPKLFSIRVLNAKGELLKEVPQLMDATLGNWELTFELLEKYLLRYNLREASQITFIADGSSNIWQHVEGMFERLGVTKYETIIDYMHAKQNIKEVIDLLNENTTFNVDKEQNEALIHEYLWQGDITAIEAYLIKEFGSLRRDKKAALKKLHNYFGSRSHLFQYSKFRKENRPIGSGSVESAIRRVINLKLKSNGIFWLKENCERMLFLRCQLLTGRWIILEERFESIRLNYYGYNVLEQNQDAA